MALKRNIDISSALLASVIDRKELLLCDGGMGTLLQAGGISGIHENPDLLNITNEQDIVEIHCRYVDAGSQCVVTNTFNSNRVKLEGTGTSVDEMYRVAQSIARKSGAQLVGGDIGPIGSLMEPLGDMSFDTAYDIFSEQAKAAEAAGCDLVFIETMTNLFEAKAAVLAAVENTRLPVFATMSFEEEGRTFLGTTPTIAATTLHALGAQAVGANCSLGPNEMAPFATQMSKMTPGAIIAQPNAGLPHLIDGITTFDVGPDEFAESMKSVVASGASIVGGCCGTTPEHIKALRYAISDMRPRNSAYVPAFTVTSGQEMVSLECGSNNIAIIGERINPTGRKRLKKAIVEHDIDYLTGEALSQSQAHADIIDVNVGVPGTDEPAMLADTVLALQSCIVTPLQLDSSDVRALDSGARLYAGRPMINSVNGTEKSLRDVLPIVARYGCTLVGLTLDEDGIPDTARARVDIAKKIIEQAARHGIPKEDIAIDCLVMSVATNQSEIHEILKAVTLCKMELGVRTVLGVSNVSFGLPHRPLLNATFLAAAFGAGLDMPILNPLDKRYDDTVNAYRALCSQDFNCASFIDEYGGKIDPYSGFDGNQIDSPNDGTRGLDGKDLQASCDSPASYVICANEFSDSSAALGLAEAILFGKAHLSSNYAGKLLEAEDALHLVDGILVPILNEVGERYERGEFFLPQLMSSAEAAKAAFSAIAAFGYENREFDNDEINGEKSKIVVATVEGDIHDIGKNIAAMLLENYGFQVIDMGKNVPSDAIVDKVKECGASLVGLSALMTTTVGAMRSTIELLHERCSNVKVMVGGAVITEEFAKEIGADYYAKDASASARIAQTHFLDEKNGMRS